MKISTILNKFSPFKAVTNNKALQDFENFKNNYEPSPCGVVLTLKKPEREFSKRYNRFSGNFKYSVKLTDLDIDDCLVLNEAILGKLFMKCRLHFANRVGNAHKHTHYRFKTVDDLENGIVRIYRVFDNVS